MFSSGNRSKENSQNYPTQWALNPSAYQNVSNENVDWAALAQQWIMMKESVPPEHPGAGSGNRKEKEILNEGGEAPMDVEKEDAEEHWQDNETSNNTVQESWNWQQWGAWPGNWNGPPPAAGITPQPATTSPMNKTALLPTPYTHFAPNTSDSNSAHSADYQSHFSYDGPGSGGGNDFGGNSSGYWTSAGSAARGKHPMKSNRTHRKGYSSDVRPETNVEPVTLDAAKRRQLPAWIREGLEKMEREKLKQIDRERERIEREEMLIRKKEEKEEAMELLRSADGSILPPKSKFDSDSGDSGDEKSNGTNNRSRAPPSQSRRSVPSSRSSSPPPALTEEERTVMVRRAMTEVLLQVTSSEIETICQEEMNRFRARTTAKKGGRPAAPSAGPFAAGTLGLGMYGGGSSESSDTESEGSGPGPGPAVAAAAEDHADERRNLPSLNNSVSEDGLDSRRYPLQLQNKEITRRRPSDTQNRRAHIAESRDAESSDSTADDGKEGGEQVDTARSHGNGSSRSRSDRRRRSSSSNSNSSSSSSRTSSSEIDKNKRKKKKSLTPKKKSHGRSPRRHRRSSSSQSDDDSSSGSKSSDSRTTSSRDVSRGNQQTRRRRSRSLDSEKRRTAPSGSGCSSNKRRRTECSRSVSSGSESRADAHRRRTESSTSSRNHNDRSRRERERSTSRSRQSTRSRRSRSRDRKDRRRSRSRTRSRDRRDSYRSRRRSRSRTRSRSGGGKRTRGH